MITIHRDVYAVVEVAQNKWRSEVVILFVLEFDLVKQFNKNTFTNTVALSQ